MKLRPLLALPLVVAMAACSKPPEITASSRLDATNKCMAEVRAAAKQAKAEQAKAAANPRLADRKTNPNYYTDFRYPYLLDSEWETVEILSVYCEPRQLKQHRGYWSNLGYIEYLVRPTGTSYVDKSEVREVIVSYGYNWKE